MLWHSINQVEQMPFNFMKQKKKHGKVILFNSKIVFSCLIINKLLFSFLYALLTVWFDCGLIYGALLILLSLSICIFVFLFSIIVLTKLLWNYAACERYLFNRSAPWREEYLPAMIYHVGNYSAKNFRSYLTSIWMFVTNKRCLDTYNSFKMQIFNIEIAVNPD